MTFHHKGPRAPRAAVRRGHRPQLIVNTSVSTHSLPARAGALARRLPQGFAERGTTITGLTPATTYYFRFRALIRKGMTDWSQTISLLVH
jgi:hypothetical protein